MEARNKGERVGYLKEGDAAVDDFLQEEKEIDVDQIIQPQARQEPNRSSNGGVGNKQGDNKTQIDEDYRSYYNDLNIKEETKQ